MHRYLTLAFFIVLVLGGGTLIGFMTLPGAWYAGLAKPAFNPPNWIFAPVWTLLYIMVAVAGWRTSNRAPHSTGMTIWFIQLALNFSWSPVFFSAHMIGEALVIVATLLVFILVYIVIHWQRDRTAALLFTPYAAWVAFATLLNSSLWYLNRHVAAG